MTQSLRVTGMTCGGCENAVKRAVGQMPGVSSVAASHQDQRVDVAFDESQVGVEAIRQKIEKLGYKVE
jgi:copper ion binding protein